MNRHKHMKRLARYLNNMKESNIYIDKYLTAIDAKLLEYHPDEDMDEFLSFIRIESALIGCQLDVLIQYAEREANE